MRSFQGVINVDEVFLNKMDNQHRSYSNDEEIDFIKKNTDIDYQLTELILWQRYCYEMENDYWEYTEGECENCGVGKQFCHGGSLLEHRQNYI